MIINRIFDKIYRIVFFILNKPFFGKLGKNSVIKKALMCKYKKRIFIGKNVCIREFARIEPVIKFSDTYYNPKIIIEDNVSIEQGIHITCANKIIIHKNCSFAPYCCITDIEHTYSFIDKPVKLNPLRVSETEIGEDCFFGTGAKIVRGCKIGKHCIIGANAVVFFDIPDFCVAAGNPAEIIKKFDSKSGQWKKINGVQ